MTDGNEHTGRHDMQEMTLDLLKEIRDRIGGIERENAELRDMIGKLSRDLDTIHKFQQSFSERLGLVERFCVERPLESTQIPKAIGGR